MNGNESGEVVDEILESGKPASGRDNRSWNNTLNEVVKSIHIRYKKRKEKRDREKERKIVKRREKENGDERDENSACKKRKMLIGRKEKQRSKIKRGHVHDLWKV